MAMDAVARDAALKAIGQSDRLDTYYTAPVALAAGEARAYDSDWNPSSSRTKMLLPRTYRSGIWSYASRIQKEQDMFRAAILEARYKLPAITSN